MVSPEFNALSMVSPEFPPAGPDGVNGEMGMALREIHATADQDRENIVKQPDGRGPRPVWLGRQGQGSDEVLQAGRRVADEVRDAPACSDLLRRSDPDEGRQRQSTAILGVGLQPR